ncbi:FAD dependent oxidoreductase [Aspergillus cavernicola]|uniref:FAD dependent oxidoreductase n=1 Tax=Aspergillus cavernicola TaxID=176166 RepID=A0ABR4J1M3_9EURO
MPTIILGGGIIGASIAYYLTEQQEKQQQQNDPEIHIIESSSTLFSSASGYAAGFLAKDWFEPSLLPLAALSFEMHESLAKAQGGEKKWGFMKGTALSLGSTDAGSGGARGDDWLRSGTSRAETATSSRPVVTEGPGWLTAQKGTAIERISEGDDVAQVDPLRLSQFLLEKAMSRGVNLHQPSKATSLITDEKGLITAVKITNIDTKIETILPCTNLIIAAGAWTPRVFESLFSSSSTTFPIYPLAGYSLVVRSPRYTAEHEAKTNGASHAVFTTHPPSCGFSPEIFSREGNEIYIAGLNSQVIPVPDRVDDLKHFFEEKEMNKLKNVMVRLMGKLPTGSPEAIEEVSNINDLEIIREGLCFRPVAERGVPFVSRVDDSVLGDGVKTSNDGGVFVASGHGPWGISLSLGTGKVVADLVRGIKPAVDISGLGVGSSRAKL